MNRPEFVSLETLPTDPNGNFEFPGDFEDQMEEAEARIDRYLEERHTHINPKEIIMDLAESYAVTGVRMGRLASTASLMALKMFRSGNSDPESPYFGKGESIWKKFRDWFVFYWNDELDCIHSSNRRIHSSDIPTWDYVEETIKIPVPASWTRHPA